MGLFVVKYIVIKPLSNALLLFFMVIFEYHIVYGTQQILKEVIAKNVKRKRNGTNVKPYLFTYGGE